MSVRKREWTTPKGVQKSAWVVDYVDTTGTRRLKTFAKKKAADTFFATATVEVREGVHVADSASVTVEKAGALWIASGESAGLERSTVNQRKSHLQHHIVPLIGQVLLSKLTVPAVRDFEDRMRNDGRSPAMAKKVLTSLGSILADAGERGLTMRNPVRDIKGSRKGRDRRQEKRQKGKLEIGVDIPTREEIKALAAALDGNWKPLLVTAIFTGMRSSELTVVDTHSRYCPAADARFTYRGEDVVQTPEGICRKTGYPKTIRVDNGSEFISRDLDLWAYANNVALDFSRPGKPTDNGFIEAFNSKLRSECLNAHWFLTLADPREKLETWRRYYNEERSHAAIGYNVPIALHNPGGATSQPS